MEWIHLPEVPSTNSWLLDALAQGKALDEGTVVYTMRQTAGRGQVGNSWESAADQNISFSLLLHPTFLPIQAQFVISEACCLGIVEALRPLLASDKQLCVKWPNDIYVGDEKLAGILIENRLMRSTLSDSVIGVGINVNQTRWLGNAPNPTSLRLQGAESTPVQILQSVVPAVLSVYAELQRGGKGAKSIHERYLKCLYRGKGLHPYVDAISGEQFKAHIIDVLPQGPLVLQTESGDRREYWFKEVRFVLPCGVTKE